MTSPADCAQPPRIANWLVNLFAAGDAGESLLGDMLEEYSHLASKSGVVFARKWYWRHTRKAIVHLLRNNFYVAPWSIVATVVGGVLLNWLISGLPERAIFAALHRYDVFDHHFSTYVFFATDGIAIGHVITSTFVGGVVAYAAKNREMAATMTLALVFCAMTAVALLPWTPTRPVFILGLLPWYVADWCAIVIGGAIIRLCRSAATNLPSAT